MSDFRTNGHLAPAAIADAISVPGLLQHHLTELQRSGLNETTIREAGIRSESNYNALAAVLNWRKLPKRMGAAIVFPYRRRDGTTPYCRLKFDNPRKIAGKLVKYESPKGQPNEIYLPPGVPELLERPESELLITEGEKKALKATQHGFSCIGLVGVFGWKDGRSARLLPALERIAWNGRPVRIVFDSDVTENPEVADAESRLAQLLCQCGAVVRVARLPGATDSEGKPAKLGLDDYLVAHGPAALRRLLDEALEPDSVAASEMKADAGSLDPATEAGDYLETGKVDDYYRLRFHSGSFTLWSQGRYSDRSMSEIRAYLVRHLNLNYRRLTTSITGNVFEQLKAQSLLDSRTEAPSWLEGPAPWPAEEILVAKNSMVHLPSIGGGQDFMLPLTPRFFTSSAVDYNFDIDAPPPAMWLSFLEQLWGDDSESINVLQEWFGYTLTPDTSQQKILMVIGPTRSGKGTIGRVNRALIGAPNVAGPTLASLGTNFGLSQLLGKSLAIISDARLGRHTDSAIVVERLLSISGEDGLTIDRKYLESITMKLLTRLMILTNELPRLGDSSGALAGRFILLRCTESFYGREDTALTKKLLTELPGILLWAIDGWRRLWKRGHFLSPSSSTDLAEQLSDLASPVGQFVRECCILGPHRSSIDDLYDAWKRWCEKAGRKEPGTKDTFGRDLLAAVPTLRKIRPREDGDRWRGYEGIIVKSGW